MFSRSSLAPTKGIRRDWVLSVTSAMGASEKKKQQWKSLRVKCLEVQGYDGATVSRF